MDTGFLLSVSLSFDFSPAISVSHPLLSFSFPLPFFSSFLMILPYLARLTVPTSMNTLTAQPQKSKQPRRNIHPSSPSVFSTFEKNLEGRHSHNNRSQLCAEVNRCASNSSSWSPTRLQRKGRGESISASSRGNTHAASKINPFKTAVLDNPYMPQNPSSSSPNLQIVLNVNEVIRRFNLFESQSPAQKLDLSFQMLLPLFVETGPVVRTSVMPTLTRTWVCNESHRKGVSAEAFEARMLNRSLPMSPQN